MIVLTGATGFVGSQLVSRLSEQNDVVLVSRDVEAAQRRFPLANIYACDSLRTIDFAGAVVIHLAARNNDRGGTLQEFRSDNVDYLLRVATIAKEGGAARFINLCSTHALGARTEDLYGLTKQEGARELLALWPDHVVNLYAPAIYGDSFQGRLAPLNRLPKFARPVALALLRQLKPVISLDNLLGILTRLAVERPARDDSWRSEHYAADPIGDRGLYAAVRRTVDLTAVLAVIGIGGWAMILIAIYIRHDSKGPSIFAQERVGRNGRPFICYKFRTMVLGTADAATHQVSATAVTRAGRFLRRTKLDELPQIFNVLMNEMSLIGPRPCLPSQTDLITLRKKRGVLGLKPGISGLAQINDIDMSDPARLAAWDDRYRVFRTLPTDVAILVRTVLGRGSGDRTAKSI